MPHASEPRDPPAFHTAAWDPMSNPRWTALPMMVDGHPKLSRVAPSSQRMRDGTLHPDRAEKLLTNPPKYLHKMHQHPEKLKDGSPRGHATPSCFDLGFPPQWQTTSRQSYEMPASNPMGGQPPAGASSSFAGGARDRQSANDGPSNRYASVALSRLSPDVYLSVFNRDAKEPPGSPRHLPIEARTTARGDRRNRAWNFFVESSVN